MPKVDEQISYNWLFFLLAGAFGAVTAWAVYDEAITRREWKTHQEEFFKIERKLAADTYENARDQLYGNPSRKDAAGRPTPVAPNPQYQKLLAQRAAIEGRRKQRAAEIVQAESEAEQTKFDFKDKEQKYTFTKSELEETYYFYTLAKHEGPNSEERKKWEGKYNALRDQLAKDDEVRAAKEKIYNEKVKRLDELTEATASRKKSQL